MRKTLDSLYTSIQAGSGRMEYLAFERVKIKDLQTIDENLKRKVRVAYFENHEVLIVKCMPSQRHEYVRGRFEFLIGMKTYSMGISEDDFVSVGSGRFYGANSTKEADVAWKSLPARAGNEWPTMTIEVGLSESLSQLRRDVRWWLIESKGDVAIALLVSIKKASSSLLLEKWELSPAPPTRPGPVTRASASNSIGEPACMQSIEVTQTGTTGGPLILEFHKIFLRPPTPPEADLIFTVQELEHMARVSLNFA